MAVRETLRLDSQLLDASRLRGGAGCRTLTPCPLPGGEGE